MPPPPRPSKAPRPAADETSLQDPDASLESLKQAIVRCARHFIGTPFAPDISSISIAVHASQDSHDAADREVDVYAYTPFNGGNASESFRRLEGYIHNLQPNEKAEFVRLVDRVRGDAGERAGDGGHKYRELVAERKALLAERDTLLAERDTHITQLKKLSKQQDADSEDNEAKTAELEALRAKLDKNTQILKDQKALNEALNDELKIWRDIDSKRSSPFLDTADDDNNATAKVSARGVIDTEDADDVEDDVEIEDEDSEDENGENETTNPDEIEFDDAEIPSDVEDVHDASELTSEKSKPLKITKPTRSISTMGSFTPMPKHPVKGKGKAAESEGESDSSEESPQDVKKGRKPSGLWLNGYSTTSKPPKNAWPEIDVDKTWKKPREKRNASKATESQGAADAATPGPSRRQSRTAAKAAQSTNDNVNEADDESAGDAEEPHKPPPKKKRKAESSDREEQPATSKKPKRKPFEKLVEEESDSEDKHIHAAQGPSVSSGTKAKLPRAKQNARRKVANDSAESEGGRSNPIDIPSGEDTDSDTEDED